MKTTVRIEGLRQLDQALGELGKAAGKAVLRRVGKKALEPMRAAAEAQAPRLEGHLQRSVAVSTKLTKRQARLARKRGGKASVMVHMGPNDPSAVPQEFGAKGDPPQPFMRPAFDAHARGAIEIVGDTLGGEIMKTARRQAARRAKL